MYIPTTNPSTKLADFFMKNYTTAKMKYHYFDNLLLWNSNKYYPIEMKCHRCIGCRLDHAQDIATRIYCECLSNNNNGCFITLTYSPNNLPHINNDENMPATLVIEHTQKFWHDLRQKYPNLSIRYVIAGEYGTKATKRPHYHACVFGYKPKDLKFYKYSKADKKIKLYKSKEITNLWKKGICIIGEIEYRSACYVARYCQKKAGLKPQKKEHQIEWIENEKAPTMLECKQYAEYLIGQSKHRNEIYKSQLLNRYAKILFQKSRIRSKKSQVQEPNKRKEEFILYSLRPAIGLEYWNTHKEEIKRNSGIFIYFEKKVKLKPIPEYFKKKWKEENPEEFYNWQYQQLKIANQQLKTKIEKLNLPNWWPFEKKVKFLREKEEQNLLNKISKAQITQRDNFV